MENDSSGTKYIAKRLDRATIKPEIIRLLGNMRSRVIYSTLSDHMAIFLSWRQESKPKGWPFKFNRVWLSDLDFIELVNAFLKEETQNGCMNGWFRMANKLIRLKGIVKNCERNKKVVQKKEYQNI